MIRTIVDYRVFIWALMAPPSIPMIGALVSAEQSGGRSIEHMLLHPTEA